MGRIEKTVFISYRRANKPWALFIYQNLTMHGYDVFIDFQNINSGNFETAILDNIRTRAHFIVVLTPSALENCKNPGDWLRREIETAVNEKRNIVPLMVEGFDFGSPLIKNALTGKLATLSQINGLRIPDDYPLEAMDRLRERYLSIALSNINLPMLQPEAKEIAIAEKSAANEAPLVKEEQLTAQTWFERGYIFSESNNFDEAIRCYTKAISLKPDFAEAFISRGAVYGEKRDLDSAILDFNEGIRLQPDSARAYNNLGVALHNKGETLNAIKNLTKSIKLKPDYAPVLSNRGSAYIDLGNYTDAIKDCTEAIQIDPNLSEAFNNRGVAFNQLGDVNQAIKDFTEAVRLKPDYAGAYRNLGNARDEKGNSKSAIRDYTKAILFKPDFADAFYDRGIAYYNTGNFDAAIKDFTQAIFIKPDFADAYKNRGIVFEIKKEHASAIADYQKYLRIGGDDKSVNLLIKNLKKKKK
ncbi:MAG: tetratricopeptide repeat protein [Anaerolineales bacterium]|nr:tetratricopeptide repeat protein [Anaerolineales bacterium]